MLRLWILCVFNEHITMLKAEACYSWYLLVDSNWMEYINICLHSSLCILFSPSMNLISPFPRQSYNIKKNHLAFNEMHFRVWVMGNISLKYNCFTHTNFKHHTLITVLFIPDQNQRKRLTWFLQDNLMLNEQK